MNISSAVHITDGTLVNNPCISRFEGVQINSSKVSRGDLFIVNANDDNIPKAIANGAYGIIFAHKSKIIDNEIAWIQVKDTDQALLALLRLIASERQIQCLYLEDEAYYIFKSLYKAMDIVFLNDFYNGLNHFFNSKQTLYFCSSDQALLSEINPKVLKLDDQKANGLLQLKADLQHTHFYYEDKFYQLNLSERFLPSFKAVFGFMQSQKLEVHLKSNIDFGFQVYYVDCELVKCLAPKAAKILIFDHCYSEAYLQASLNYLTKEKYFFKTLYFVPKSSAFEDFDGTIYIVYKDKKDLKQKLLNHQFDLAYIIEDAKKNLQDIVLDKPEKIEQKTLF